MDIEQVDISLEPNLNSIPSDIIQPVNNLNDSKDINASPSSLRANAFIKIKGSPKTSRVSPKSRNDLYPFCAVTD